MSKVNIWGWDKKQRTLIRFIKIGDIFCFRLNEEKYCFGRIIAKLPGGHVAEIFDYISTEAIINVKDIERATRLTQLVLLDTYSLFDRKSEGEWRIIGNQEDYVPSNVEGIYFTYGIGPWCKKVDVFRNETPIKEEEQSKYIRMSPRGDIDVKNMVGDALKHS